MPVRDVLIVGAGPSGLATAIGGLSAQLIPGATQLHDGLVGAHAGTHDLATGAGQLAGGLHKVQSGLDDLADGVAAATEAVDSGAAAQALDALSSLTATLAPR